MLESSRSHYPPTRRLIDQLCNGKQGQAELPVAQEGAVLVAEVMNKNMVSDWCRTFLCTGNNNVSSLC